MRYYRRQTIGGYLFMGKARIPPLPMNIVMTDRTTGTDYFLSHTGDVGSLVASLSTTIPTKPDTRTYGPYDGPYVDGTIRLYVSNAVLLAERISPADYQIHTQRVLTRSGNGRTFLEVAVADDLSISYTEVDE